MWRGSEEYGRVCSGGPEVRGTLALCGNISCVSVSAVLSTFCKPFAPISSDDFLKRALLFLFSSFAFLKRALLLLFSSFASEEVFLVSTRSADCDLTKLAA